MNSRRLQILSQHLIECPAPERPAAFYDPISLESTAGATPMSADDIVIVCALRTPICRAKRGPLKDTPPEYLLSTVLSAVLERTKIRPDLVEDITVGSVLQPGAFAARMAALAAGFPESTSVMTVNRQCSSGLQAVANVAAAIKSGTIKCGIGAGMESMSLQYNAKAFPSKPCDPFEKLNMKSVNDCLLPMGVTSENVARDFGVSREKQDRAAAASHQRAAKAQKEGLFDEEIVPVRTTVVDEKGEKHEIVVTKDDGIRPDATFESLSKLKPAFSPTGTTTAGNASQVSDGAAAVLLMTRHMAQELRLPILGRFVSYAVAGVPPHIMGIGPAVAIPKALERAALSTSEISLYEINEAFASQFVYCAEKLGLDMEKVNPKGGAIAFGHPLGCTGARQIATLLPELKRTGGRYGVVSMCIGTGMGAAAVIERE